MPLYVYRCPACHHEVEEMRTVANRDNAPVCYGLLDEPSIPMERVPTAAAFTVRGHSAANGYHRVSSEEQPSHLKGIRTEVRER